MRNSIAAILTLTLLASCGDSASDGAVADRNLSVAASQFELNRRVVFYNGITGNYILSVEGRCMMNYDAGQVSVVCKTGPNEFKRNMLGLSDNVTYFVEQLEPANTNVYHYRVIFKPQVIVPDVELHGNMEELTK